jgi:hypothetical protein
MFKIFHLDNDPVRKSDPDQPDPGFDFSIAIGTLIENLIRINQTLVLIFQSRSGP